MSMMLILDEEILVGAICSERYSCYAQPRKSSFEPIETCEGSCVSPLFPGRIVYQLKQHSKFLRVLRAYNLAHGSFVGWPDDAASLRISKPVRLGRGAMISNISSALVLMSVRARYIRRSNVSESATPFSKPQGGDR